MHPLRLTIGSVKLKPHALLDAVKSALSPGDNVLVEMVRECVSITAADESQILFAAAEIRDRLGTDVEIGAVTVEYRETITRAVEIEGRIRETTPPTYAQLWLRLIPGEAGKGVTIVSRSDVVPAHFLPAVEAGLREALLTGPIAGHPVTDVEVTLFDGSYHDRDSTEEAFRSAALVACKNAVVKGRPVLLEPIMFVEVTTPVEVMGNVAGDLSARRGMITAMEELASGMLIRAKVPLVEMLDYASDLAKLTAGKGDSSSRFSHYVKAPLPGDPDGDKPASMALRVA